MQVGRVYLVWVLLLVGLAALVGGTVTRWYEFDSAAEGFAPNAEDEIAPPHYQLHTDFWHEGHEQYEGWAGGIGDASGTRGADAMPQIAQVMTIVRIFYFTGLMGAAVAVVGVLFRMRGLPDGKGLIASIALFSILFVGFASAYFAVGIPGAYNDVLEAERGESPEIGFYTWGIESDDGVWRDVTSAPRTGWYLSVAGVAALILGFGAAYLAEVRLARDVITSDQAAAQARAGRRERDAQGIERFRREERP